MVERALHERAMDLDERDDINLLEALIDGTFGSAELRLNAVNATRSSGTRIMAVADAYGLLNVICIENLWPGQ